MCLKLFLFFNHCVLSCIHMSLNMTDYAVICARVKYNFVEGQHLLNYFLIYLSVYLKQKVPISKIFKFKYLKSVSIQLDYRKKNFIWHSLFLLQDITFIAMNSLLNSYNFSLQFLSYSNKNIFTVHTRLESAGFLYLSG